MELLGWEIKMGFFKGLCLGIRHYNFTTEETYEKDVVVYLGIFQIIITRIYEL